MNTTESQAIEVEVLEIDGSAPQPTFASEPPPKSAPWMQWQGRIRQLDRRWWPLWVLLGGVALSLLLTLGLVVAVILLILKLLQGIARIFR
jgi:hypothetical protein